MKTAGSAEGFVRYFSVAVFALRSQKSSKIFVDEDFVIFRDEPKLFRAKAV